MTISGNVSIGGVNEITGYVFAITTTWAMPLALWSRANVRIDAFYTHAGLRLRVFFEFLALTSLALFFGYLTFRGGEYMLDSFAADRRSNTSLQTPVAIPQMLWTFGFLVQLATLAALARRMVHASRGGDYDTAVTVLASDSGAAVAGSKVASAQSYSVGNSK